MQKMIRTALAASLMLSAAASMAQVVIEGFENSADPVAWVQVSSSPQSHNHTNSTVPVYGPNNVTEGVQSGRFPHLWTLPPTATAAASNPHVSGGPLTFWAMRNNVTTPANFPSLISNSGVLSANVFNNSATDSFQFAFYVQDSNGSGGLERGPWVTLPPNTGTVVTWDLQNQVPSGGFITGNGTLDGAASTLKGFFIYTETAPTGNVDIDVDNITLVAQSDLVPPAPPIILSASQGTNPGEVNVTWAAGTEPDLAGYRIYVADDTHFGTPIANRFGFPTTHTAEVLNPAATGTTLTGLNADTTYYIRLTAVDNATPNLNESLSDIVLPVRLKADGSAGSDLVVFDLDRYTPADSGFTQNGYLHSGAYWGQALASNNRYFGSARAAAVDSGAVLLTSASSIVYWTTNWDGELVADQTLTAASQIAIAGLLSGGGNLAIAGSSIGKDLTTNGDVNDQAFYAATLKAALANENVNVGEIQGDSFFAVSGSLATATDIFNVAGGANLNNEALTAQGTAVGSLTYTGITPGNAAILDSNSLVYLGFAFESVRPALTTTVFSEGATARANLVTDVINYLDAPPQLDAEQWNMYE